MLRLSLCTLLAITFSFSPLTAQELKQNDWIGGATTGIIGNYAAANYWGTEEDFKLSISLAPEIGTMISKRTLVGAQLGFGLETDFTSSVMILGLTPFIRSYNKVSGKLLPFFEASAGLFMVNATPSIDYGGLVSVRFGVDYFLSENVLIGGRFGPALTFFNDLFNLDLSLRFGLSIVF